MKVAHKGQELQRYADMIKDPVGLSPLTNPYSINLQNRKNQQIQNLTTTTLFKATSN